MLVKSLRDKDPQVRTKAALVLAELGSKAEPAVPMLTRILEEEDPQLRLTAALVIARIERKKAEIPLRAQRIIREVQRQMEGVMASQATLQLHPALADPVVQIRSRQVVMFYIMSKMMMPSASPADNMLELLGPESVPALVEGINFVAANQIGTC